MKNALLITTSRRALLRCLALSAMGLHALLYPAGLRGTTALYAAVYLLAFGLLALRDSLTLRGRGRSARLACGMIAFMMGAAALLWQRSEPRTLPVFFGAFMLMAGAQYLVVGAASRTGGAALAAADHGGRHRAVPAVLHRERVRAALGAAGHTDAHVRTVRNAASSCGVAAQVRMSSTRSSIRLPCPAGTVAPSTASTRAILGARRRTRPARSSKRSGAVIGAKRSGTTAS